MFLRPCAAREFSPPSGKKLHDVDHVIHVKKTERGRQPQDSDLSKEKKYHENVPKSQPLASGGLNYRFKIAPSLGLRLRNPNFTKKKFGYLFSEGKKGEGQWVHLDWTLAATFFLPK